MSKIRELIESEICNKISDVKIIDSQNEISGCDDDFSLSYKDKIIEVFFLSKGNGYKFCHDYNLSEWKDKGIINIKNFDKYSELENNKDSIIGILKSIINFHKESQI